jgi:hypothetical protein
VGPLKFWVIPARSVFYKCGHKDLICSKSTQASPLSSRHRLKEFTERILLRDFDNPSTFPAPWPKSKPPRSVLGCTRHNPKFCPNLEFGRLFCLGNPKCLFKACQALQMTLIHAWTTPACRKTSGLLPLPSPRAPTPHLCVLCVS